MSVGRGRGRAPVHPDGGAPGAPFRDPEGERPRAPVALLDRQPHGALPGIARLHPEADGASGRQRGRDPRRRVLVHLESRPVPRRDVMTERREEPHDVRRAARDEVPVLAHAPAAAEILGAAVAGERIDVEVALAVQRHAGQDRVVEGAVDEIREAALACREQHAPAPQDAGDRGARLVVGEVVRELVGLAEGLAQVARADAARHVELVAREIRPLAVERAQERGLPGLEVHVRDARGEIERADGMALELRRVADGDAVLVVGGAVVPTGAEPGVPALIEEEPCELERNAGRRSRGRAR